MIKADDLYHMFIHMGVDFFTGVPDSTLKHFTNYLLSKKGIGGAHIVAANEGNAVALAAGHYLATKKPALVYLQNSGIGNIINPVTSLTDHEVYGIPVIYVIGWRGRPGTKDEPQHIKQGKITEELLQVVGIDCYIVSKDTDITELEKIAEHACTEFLDNGKSIAFLIEPGALEKVAGYTLDTGYEIEREEAVCKIADAQLLGDLIVSTTGKASRELFEYRVTSAKGHEKDFLTVGSMGHASMIALGIANEKPKRGVWCIDGDGAAIMHMGSMATIGSEKPENFYHILINNGSHETVGGVPTVSYGIDWKKIAEALGYEKSYSITERSKLEHILSEARRQKGPVFIEIRTTSNSRENLIRPTTTPKENKERFMNYITV